MDGVLIDAYTQALVLTLLIEAVVLAPWLPDGPDKTRVITGFLGVNLFTHGLLWTLFSTLPWSYPTSVAIAEGMVMASEALVYAVILGFSARKALALSALANTLSTVVGLFIAGST